METLKMIFLGCLIVLGILFSILLIISLLGVIFEPLTRKRKQKEAEEAFNNLMTCLGELNKALDEVDEETKPKKKPRKKATKTKEEK